MEDMQNEQYSDQGINDDNTIAEVEERIEGVHLKDSNYSISNNDILTEMVKESDYNSREGSKVHKDNLTYSTSEFPCHPAPPLDVKLFVGRIPRTYTEDDLKPIFEKYGKVVGVTIIRDKNNSTHKGCAFVRMACLAEADGAVRALNNQKNLDETLGPLQVKYATGEAEKLGISDATGEPGLDQAKLFIGSIPKSMTEKEVKEFFSPYGLVDEIYIMKDSSNGSGKGCAFVKYAYKEQAIHAVKSLDRKHTFEGCSRPIEVRFAESRTQRQQTQQLQIAAAPVPSPSAIMPSLLPCGGVVAVPPAALRPAFPASGLPAAAYVVPPFAQIGTTIPAAPVSVSVPWQAGVWKEYFNSDGRPYYHNEATNQTQWEKPPEFDQQGKMTASTATGQSTALTAATSTPNTVAYFSAAIPAAGVSVGPSFVSQVIGAGPPGANIFVFHVPPEWTQADLLAVFSPFGKVISARVATDNACDNKTKGYAFISYDNCLSAVSAVCHMNGFVWGSKKLKVTIKKGEEHAVQHLLPPSFGGTATGSATALVPAANPAALASAANPAILASAVGGLYALQPGAIAAVGALGIGATAASQAAACGATGSATETLGTATGQVGAAGSTVPAAASGAGSAAAATYAACNGSGVTAQPGNAGLGNQYTLQQGLAQYNFQAAAAAAQYGAYGFVRYAPY